MELEAAASLEDKYTRALSNTATAGIGGTILREQWIADDMYIPSTMALWRRRTRRALHGMVSPCGMVHLPSSLPLTGCMPSQPIEGQVAGNPVYKFLFIDHEIDHFRCSCCLRCCLPSTAAPRESAATSVQLVFTDRQLRHDALALVLSAPAGHRHAFLR